MSSTETRKRSHILDRARFIPLPSKIDLTPTPLSPTDYTTESGGESSGDTSMGTKATSDSSLDEQLRSKSHSKSPIRPSPHVRSASQTPSYTERPGRPPKASSAWYELDLAIVIALVSPVVNWVTGADHIKNGLLLLLLLFYLHQIIEVPWTLYNQARARRSQSPHSASDSLAQTRRAASSRLHTLEIFYFALTLASPILGAVLLRTFAAYIAGSADVISWFSTGLFVLATAIRPWKHLLQRCSSKAEELHDIVHYPSDEKVAQSADTSIFEARMEALEQALGRVTELERSLTEMKHTLAGVEEDTDESLISVERTVKKHSKRIAQLEERPPPKCTHTCAPTVTSPMSWLSILLGTNPPPPPPRSPPSSPPFNLKRFPTRATLETIPEDGASQSFAFIHSEPYMDGGKGIGMIAYLVAVLLRMVRYFSLAPFKLIGLIIVHLLGGPSTK